MLGLDWQRILAPTVSALEVILRGSVVYLALFTLLRVVLKREPGQLAITDLLVVVLIADAAQNAMSGGYTSVFDGLALVATIVFWSYALDWLGYRFPRLEPFVHPPPLALIRDGQLLYRNLRRELLTESELRSQLRRQGVEDIDEVKAAYIEGDGRISVLLRDGRRPRPPDRPVD